MNTGAQALSTAGSAIHGQIQDVRARRAQNETNLNSTLLQLVPSGANESEVRAMQERVQRYVRENHLDMGATVEALSGAQSRFNALGAASPQARMAALNQTLSDVSFANVINPNDLNGIPQFSAMLRQQGVSDEMRTQILRNTTGISFAGSVETQQAIEQGLPAMLGSLSTTLATAPAGSNRDALVRDSIADFMAQIQTNAASGGRVAVSGNRANTLRTALGNDTTQNRLGNALSQRRMTDEQREVFNRSFSRGRDGRYVMSESVRNSPSEAAAMFGHLFNNDPTALANFLGPRGGGGRRQLLNRPEVGLLRSYFNSGQDSQGRTVRQYEAVNDLRRQSISAEQFDMMKNIRAQEDRNNLQDNENARVEALGNNTSALNQLSNAIIAFSSNNPVLSAILGAGATAAGPWIAGKVGAALAPGGATTAAEGGGLIASAGRGILRAGTRLAGGAAFLSDLLRPGNEDQGYFDDAAALRAHRGGGTAAQVSAAASRGSQRELLEGIQRAVRDGAREGTAGTAHGNVHAANNAALEATHRATRDGTR
jgi:hypothetical protein